MTLPPKLAYLFSQIPPHAKVADIGTDHAYLPIALCRAGRCDSIIACDIGEKPLRFAQRHLEAAGCTAVDLRKSDGLQAIAADEVDTVVIAGMGGEVISRIIAQCAYAKSPRLTYLLQPMTGAVFLRRFLAQNGFAVIREEAVEENGRVYSVMTVAYDGHPYALSPAREEIGLFTGSTPAQRQYIAKRVKILRACLTALESRPDQTAEAARCRRALNAIRALTDESF